MLQHYSSGRCIEHQILELCYRHWINGRLFWLSRKTKFFESTIAPWSGYSPRLGQQCPLARWRFWCMVITLQTRSKLSSSYDKSRSEPI